ncbi:MAG: hypothetical protein ACFB8W_07460 [Elainellaceae cyanobacterium]
MKISNVGLPIFCLLGVLLVFSCADVDRTERQAPPQTSSDTADSIDDSTEPIVADTGDTGDRPPSDADQVADSLAEDSIALALDAEGLRLVDAATGSTRALPFGMERDGMMEILLNLRQIPLDQGVNPECGAGPLSFARWPDGLTLWFEGDRFAGWAVDGRAENAAQLTTIGGIGTGSTRTELSQVYSAEVFQSSLGTEFIAGGLGGVLSGSGEDAQIATLWSGTTCIFR